MFAVVELCKQQDGKAVRQVAGHSPAFQTFRQLCRFVLTEKESEMSMQMSKPDFTFEVYFSSGELAMSRSCSCCSVPPFTRAETAQKIRYFRKDRTKFKVVRNENAFCTELIGTGMVAVLKEI